MIYDEELDEWICANNKHLVFTYESKRKSDNGFHEMTILSVFLYPTNPI